MISKGGTVGPTNHLFISSASLEYLAHEFGSRNPSLHFVPDYGGAVWAKTVVIDCVSCLLYRSLGIRFKDIDTGER